MSKPALQALRNRDRAADWIQEVVIVIGASLFVALCARMTLPLPFTPVPLTLQNFGALLVGLLLGSRRGFAALTLYLAGGLAGMPVFNPTGPGGLAQLLGPTGGFLFAYPFVAGLAGWIMERGTKSLVRSATAAMMGEIVLFSGGLSWLAVLTHSLSKALQWGFYWFIFAEIIKVMLAAAITTGWQRVHKVAG
jgi:biotin transport system substrate-specific component